MEGGFIKISRNLLNWGWYGDAMTKIVFLDILLNANYKDGEYRGHKVKAGECVIGRKAMAERLGISEQNVRTALTHLHDSGEIVTIKVTNKFRIVRVEKWAVYQGWYETSGRQSNQQVTSNRPASNQQVTTSNKGNKGNKENNYIWKHNDHPEWDEPDRFWSYEQFMEDLNKEFPNG